MKSEVRALEQAVCVLLAKLDLLFTAEWGLELFNVNRGVDISTPDHLCIGEDAFVTISPTGWPMGAYIRARFYNSGLGWTLYEGGEIHADHLDIPVSRIGFKPSDNVMGIELDFFDDSSRQFVMNGYARLIGSLQEDLQKHKK